MKKFDFVIGNPPYQVQNDTNGRQPPVYHLLMQEAFKVSVVTEMITPARFLFNAGQTPKAFNETMLHDPHFKVLEYYPSNIKVFANTDIKGGVAITLRNSQEKYGEINKFIENNTLRAIFKKVNSNGEASLDSIHYNRSSYRFKSEIVTENKKLFSEIKPADRLSISSNIFDKLSPLFVEENIQNHMTGVLGRDNNARTIKWIKKDYIENHENLDTWKVFVAKSNGTGEFGETLSQIEVVKPNIIGTQTFISFGKFESEEEATALCSYIKTKFCRCLLGVNKVTPDNARKEVWASIPLQNFTKLSDIDWSKSIHEIDQQLYKKYGLTDEEISFIEANVKEME